MPLRPRTPISSLVAIVLVAFSLFATACGTASEGEAAATTPASAAPADLGAERPDSDSPAEQQVDIEPTPVPFVQTVTDAQVLQATQDFLEVRSTVNARSIVQAVDGNRDERWVPWMLDLLRVNVSLQVSNQISTTLETIIGIESTARIPNMIEYGAWAQNRGLDGGDGYREYKASLYERIDTEFGPLLRSIEDQTELAAVQWGGVPVGGIPELNDPARVPAADADWMFDDEIVLGIVANGQAVAYPLRILARHELANDTIGGEPLALVYCTLCRSALVFERNVNGQTLNFLTSGLLLNSNKIMYDRETETLWSHLRGIGIGGSLTGTELTLRSVNHMRWSDWVAENPNTQVLELPSPIFFDDPERPPISYDYTPGEAYKSYYDNEDVWFPILDTPDTFDIKTEVVGISHNDDAVAFDVAVFNELDETTELLVGGATFTIEPTGPGVRVFDANGDRVIVEQSFWFAWFANNPDTRTWDPTE